MNRAIHSSIRLTCLIVPALALAACGEKEPDAKAEAAGEILSGSIDDAMLPLDSVRSQPPLAPQTEAAAAQGGANADVEEMVEVPGEAATATDAATAPALTIPTAAPPTPTPSAPAKAQ